MKKRRRFLGVLLAVLMAASVFPAFPIGASAAITPEEFDSLIIPVTVKEGETIVLTNDNFLEAAAELLKIVDPEYVLEIPAETPSGDKNPDTGDAQDMSLWIITVFISGFTAVILIVPCRRRRVSKAE